jgi:hypothetical protein
MYGRRDEDEEKGDRAKGKEQLRTTKEMKNESNALAGGGEYERTQKIRYRGRQRRRDRLSRGERKRKTNQAGAWCSQSKGIAFIGNEHKQQVTTTEIATTTTMRNRKPHKYQETHRPSHRKRNDQTNDSSSNVMMMKRNV